jgi:outer membrane protein assembly factor BamB
MLFCDLFPIFHNSLTTGGAPVFSAATKITAMAKILHTTQFLTVSAKTPYTFLGDINENITLGDIVQTLLNKKREGQLKITNDEVGEILLCIRGNNIGLISSPSLQWQYLPEKLYYSGQISQELYAETHHKKSEEAIAILQEEANEGTRRVIEIVCYDEICKILNYQKGKFQFNQESSPDSLPGGVFPAEATLMEAARRHDEWPKITAILPPLHEMLLHNLENPENLAQIPAQQPLGNIWRLSHHRSIKNILRFSCISEFDATKILGSLISKQYLRPLTNDELVHYAEESETRQQLSEAKDCYELLLLRKADAPAISEKIAHFYQKAGNNLAAAELYRFLANVLVNSADMAKQRQAAVYLKKITDLLPDSQDALESRMQLFDIITQKKITEPNFVYDTVGEGKKLFHALQQKGQTAKAQQVLTMLFTLTHDDVELLHDALQLSLSKRDTAQALTYYQNLAAVYEKQHLLKKMQDCYQKILALDPNRQDIRSCLLVVKRSIRKKYIYLLFAAILGLCSIVAYIWVRWQQQQQQYLEAILTKLETDIARNRWREVQEQWQTISAEAKKNMPIRTATIERSMQDHAQQLWQKALEHEKQGDLLAARQFLEEGANLTPSYSQKTDIAQKLQNLNSSIADFRSILQTAQQYEQEKNYAKAIENYLAIWNNEHFKKMPDYKKIKLPIRCIIKPVNVAINIDGQHYTNLAQQEETIAIPPDFQKLQIVLPGYQPHNYYNAFYTFSDKILVNKQGERLYPLPNEVRLQLQKIHHNFFTLTAAAESEICYNDDTLYVTCRDGYLYAFTTDLRLKWSFRVNDGIGFSSGPCLDKGILYIGSKDKTLYAIRTPSEGRENVVIAAQFSLAGTLIAAPMVAPCGQIVCVDNTGIIWAFPMKAETISPWLPLWRYAAEEKLCSPALTEDKLISVNQHNELLAIDLQTGNKIFSHPLVYSVYAIAYTNNTIYLGCAEYICALDIKKLTEYWATKVEGAVLGKPLVADGKIYCTTSENMVYALSAQYGNILWELRMQEGGFRTSLAINGQILYLTCQEGLVYAVRNGEILWKYKVEGQRISSPLAVDNLVFVASRKIYSFLNN